MRSADRFPLRDPNQEEFETCSEKACEEPRAASGLTIQPHNALAVNVRHVDNSAPTVVPLRRRRELDRDVPVTVSELLVAVAEELRARRPREAGVASGMQDAPKLVRVLLPVRFNDGAAIPLYLLAACCADLAEQGGGVTISAAAGVCRTKDAVVEVDELIAVELWCPDTGRVEGILQYWRPRFCQRALYFVTWHGARAYLLSERSTRRERAPQAQRDRF